MRWDFWQRARAFLRPETRVLLVGREGLEDLLALGHPLCLLALALPPFLLWLRISLAASRASSSGSLPDTAA